MRLIMMMATALAVVFGSVTLHAQTLGPGSVPYQMPPDDQRCPSKWGADDQRGSGNWMKPETVLRAVKLIRTGEVFELGDVLDPETFLQGSRIYKVYTKPPVEAAGGGVENEELIVTELGQVGTQLDGFAHHSHYNSYYNCIKDADIRTRSGFKKLGIEHVGMLMSRGVLIDVAALKGVEMLSEGYAISLEDVQQALAREKMTLQPGDAVIINTGWGKLRPKENVRYAGAGPGIGMAVAQWLVHQDPMLVGTDTCCVEVRTLPFMAPIHTMILVQYGVHLIENMKLDALAAARVYEFAFVMQPLKLKGATGSTVVPVAIR